MNKIKDINKRKIIRDILHGYIYINKYEWTIIDNPIFQRLLRIRQGITYPAYPSCNHTRFEHSLGVMHLGRLALESIINTTNGNEKHYFEEHRDTVSFACLLHDIGHAPLSHLGEQFYQKNEIIKALNLLSAHLK